MEFITTLDYLLIKDCILIGLCSICAIYCLLLSKRLRRLNDMRKGLGASIVSLTEAIEITHQASQASRRDITASITEMQDLISKADSKANTLEARLTEIKRNVKTADEVANALSSVIDLKAPLALHQIKAVSERLLKITDTIQSETLIQDEREVA